MVQRIAAEVSCCLADMRLESVDIDPIYAGICVLVRFGSTTRRTKNRPYARITEWNEEIILWVTLCPFLQLKLIIPRPSDLPVSVTICGVFQLGSTLGTREISTAQTISVTDLSGNAHCECRDEALAPHLKLVK